ASLQHEKALSAAARIEQFVLQIEQQLAYAALPQLGVEGLEQRRIEFLKLLRVVHAVTDITQIDGQGREQLSVSRLKMDEAGTGRDWSQEPAFKNARPGQTWYGPVYFRKETEPYMSIAVRSGGEAGAVTVAEVNLKFIWDVITRIHVGQKGKAYVVDGSGHLVADPDIGLVLRKTSMSHLEQVQAALKPDADDMLAMLAKDLAGQRVLTAYAPIEPGRDQQGGKPTPLGWKVFVEQPVAEVFQALNATILRTVGLMIAGLLFSALVAMWLARSMARPIGVLQDGAMRIGAGDLDAHIEVKTGDELESLADQFNRMTAQLRESYASLERKVEERTAELQQSLEQQTAISEILRVISSSPSDVQPVLQAVAERAARICDAPYADIMVREGDKIFARAGVGAIGRTGPEEGVPLDRNTAMGRSIIDREVIHVADSQNPPPGEFEVGRSMALKYGHRTTLAVPLVREDKAVGTILLRRMEMKPFADKHIAVLKTFADQAAIAIENVRLFNETRETLDQQTATGKILRVIAESPTEVQPVFDAIASSALRLFELDVGAVTVVLAKEGRIELAALAAHTHMQGSWRASYPMPLEANSVTGRTILEMKMQSSGALDGSDAPELDRNVDTRVKVKSVVGAPMVREGIGIGAIMLFRATPGRFDDKQLALLRTFADQAAIAIQNVRLFNETKESLEQQTATSEILKVISGSPTDVQPVLEAIVQSAARLFAPCNATVFMRDGGLVRLRAVDGLTIDQPAREALARIYPVAFDPEVSTSARAMAERRVNVCLDTEAPNVPEHIRRAGRAGGFRSNTVVPLIRDDEGIGTIVLTHPKAGYKLTDKQLALVRTFADQAVIAIENVRLFNETKESLEQQTAISEVLRVISASPSDVKPTLDAVAARAARLCEAVAVALYTLEGETLRRAAFNGPAELQGSETLPFTPGTLTGRTIAQGKAIHIENLEREQGEFPVSWELGQKYGRQQSMLAVPLTREGRPFGTMFLRRVEVRPFTEKQIGLATTFADQAAIAIENVRLFNETKEALEQQKASGEVLGAISSSIADTKPVFDKILRSCERLFEGNLVGITLATPDNKVELVAYEGENRDQIAALYPMALSREAGTGCAILDRKVVHFADVRAGSAPTQVVKGAQALGFKTIIFAPMLFEGRGIGAIWVARKLAEPFSDKQITLLKTFADQAVIAIQNARLFREIQEKSVQLEVANKHKSDFLANMSHELRTPLNAIIGFSEVLMERMFGEVNDKQADYLKDIHESGKHLLSLINDILDLSKIEAGRMDLEISSFHLPTALSNAMTLVRERAQRHGIQLGLQVDPRIGEFQADERKVKQILVNLLSNAVKFTPDGGRVDVSAKLDTTKVEIAVKDTGIGIASEDQGLVFEEFKQVGRDYTRKAEGTGLGLALTKRFVELHGGEIHLQSTPGKGSTFTVTLPVRT
ncbi:MAG TPA: GAF domain-containing protein, partial [Burkholderiales bacterium]